MSNTKPLRAAVIGLGTMGANHARVYGELPDVELVAVADVDPGRVARFLRGRTVAGYTDYRKLLSEQRPDIVSVAVPTRLHAEVAHTVIAQGAHLLIEKPLTATLAEGRAVMEHATAAGVVLSVGHIERFNPAVQELKRYLMSGTLGRLLQVSARRLGPFPDRIRDVGVVHDLAPHDIDVMSYLIESSVVRVYAETRRQVNTDYEDIMNGLLRFANGVIGVLDVNWLSPVKVRQLSVLGERGMFLVDYLTQDLWLYENPRFQGSWLTLETFTGTAEGAVTKLPVEKQEPLRRELEAFVTCVRENLPPPVPPAAALAAMEIADRLVESGRTGTVIDCQRPK